MNLLLYEKPEMAVSDFLPGRTSSHADCITWPVVLSATQTYSPASSVVTLCRSSVYTFDALLCRACTGEMILRKSSKWGRENQN